MTLAWSGSACLVAAAGDDVDEAGREAGQLDDGCQGESAERSVLGWLTDRGAAGSQRGRDLPGRHSYGEVPGADHGGHTQRLPHSQELLPGHGGVDELS